MIHNFPMPQLRIVILFMLMFLTACESTSTAIATQTPQVAKISQIKTVTPTSKPPTPTNLPPTLTYPPLPVSILNDRTSLDASETQIAPFHPEWYSCDAYNLMFPMLINFSPDKNWMATYCEHQFGNISLINTQGKIWRITDKQLFGVVRDIVFNPEKWAKDGKSLYFSTTHPYSTLWVSAETPTVPPGTPTELPWCFNPYIVTLVKANFKTHTTKFILGNKDAYKNDWPDDFYTFAFSPTENYLAYSLQDRKGSKVSIKDLENNSETMFVIENGSESDVVINRLVWFADETKILADQIICTNFKRKLTIVDLQNGQQITIPIDVPDEFLIRGWDQSDLIILEKSNEYYYLNLKGNKIVGPIS